LEYKLKNKESKLHHMLQGILLELLCLLSKLMELRFCILVILVVNKIGILCKQKYLQLMLISLYQKVHSV